MAHQVRASREARTWWAMALAVREMIGVRPRPSRASSSRMRRMALRPSITGIWVSISTTSKPWPARASDTAWAPSPTITSSAASPSSSCTTF